MNEHGSEYLTNQNIIEIVKMYDARWKHQNNQFWSVLIKLSFVSYSIILFPFLYELFDIDLDRIELTPIIFPALGTALSVLFLLINISNAGRQLAMKKTISNILSQFKLEPLKEVRFDEIEIDGLAMKWMQKRVLSNIISYGNFSIQVLLSTGVIILLAR